MPERDVSEGLRQTARGLFKVSQARSVTRRFHAADRPLMKEHRLIEKMLATFGRLWIAPAGRGRSIRYSWTRCSISSAPTPTARTTGRRRTSSSASWDEESQTRACPSDGGADR